MTTPLPLSLATPNIAVERRTDGSMLLCSREVLRDHPQLLGDVLARAADRSPDRTFLAERRNGEWHRITYRTALEQARAVAQFLVDRELDRSTPVAILSGNSIRHALVSLGASLVGVPVVPVTPAYSLASRKHRRLKSVVEMLQPKMVFVEEVEPFTTALGAIELQDRIAVTGSSTADFPNVLPFDAVLGTPVDEQRLRQRIAQVMPDHTAKYMLTSGSTGSPKPVITTHAMLCANQQMIAQLWPFLEEEPPILVDWLPWSHTYGGGKIFNLTMWHGGSLYIDNGKPVPGQMDATVQNLREVSPTLYFNVPRGLALLVPHLESDDAVRESFFARLGMICFAAAALPTHLWTRLHELWAATTGERSVFVSSGFGSTETSPTSTLVHFPTSDPRVIGLPAPGVELKLVPAEAGKMEIRVRGPHVTSEYHGSPDVTRAAFDDEGYFRFGDAARFADPLDVNMGLVFDGRLAEDFKLATGTWVNVGTLRVAILAATAPLLSDIVPTAPDRDYLGLLAWLSPSVAEHASDPNMHAELAEKLQAFNREHPGTSTTVRRILLLSEPPSFEDGEITDKQYVNQRAVRERRTAEVEQLYADASDSEVIIM